MKCAISVQIFPQTPDCCSVCRAVPWYVKLSIDELKCRQYKIIFNLPDCYLQALTVYLHRYSSTQLGIIRLWIVGHHPKCCPVIFIHLIIFRCAISSSSKHFKCSIQFIPPSPFYRAAGISALLLNFIVRLGGTFTHACRMWKSKSHPSCLQSVAALWGKRASLCLRAVLISPS